MRYATYDRIGAGYDSTRRADPYLVERIHSLLELSAGKEVIDIGCGTGNYTMALHDRGLRLTAVDPSERMLEQARRKTGTVRWIRGDAGSLPFPDDAFDGAIATLTTHHWANISTGFREAHRALRPGAPLVILTSTPDQMRHYWLCHYFPEAMERSRSVMSSAPALEEELRSAGFTFIANEPYAVRPDLQDLFLYSAKDDPERYLDPGFRNGISTFTALTDAAELRSGLDRLERDIASGAWKRIRKAAEHDGGDYLFIIAHA